MALLQVAGGQPGTREYAALLEACKRSNRAAHAAHILHTVMPAAGVLPDVRAWNALLGAYGRNGDIDGAYATWQVRLNPAAGHGGADGGHTYTCCCGTGAVLLR